MGLVRCSEIRSASRRYHNRIEIDEAYLPCFYQRTLEVVSMRCNGCGKELGVQDEVVRVAHGVLREDGFHEKKGWGIFHRSCFNRSLSSPKAAQDELARLMTAHKNGHQS